MEVAGSLKGWLFLVRLYDVIIQDITTQIFSLQCKPPTKSNTSPLKIEYNMRDKTRFSRCKLPDHRVEFDTYS
jgi:hypothetical protein